MGYYPFPGFLLRLRFLVATGSTWLRTWPRSRAWDHDRPAKRATARTIEPAVLRPGSEHATEGLCSDKAFSVTTRVVGFHAATWSIMSRHGYSVIGATVS